MPPESIVDRVHDIENWRRLHVARLEARRQSDEARLLHVLNIYRRHLGQRINDLHKAAEQLYKESGVKTRIPILAAAAILSSAVQIATATNVVLIVPDDLGYGDVSYNGNTEFTTPNIDALAAGGVRLPNGYATHCFCSPARAGLMTGRYQQRFGHEHQPANNADNVRQGVPLSEILLPQLMKQAGLYTGMVGKWHLGSHRDLWPTNRGFDEFYGFIEAQSNYYTAPLLRNTTKVVEQQYLTDAFTREAVAFINRNAAHPFFLCLAYNAPHQPYTMPPQNYLDQVATITNPERRIYAAMVKALDGGIGQVTSALQANNLLDNTLIIFLTDHGAPLNAYAGKPSTAPFRGGKNMVLEGGIHLPFLISWQNHLAAQTYESPVSSLDILPTAVAAVGGTLPTDRQYDGFNLLPSLIAKTPIQRDLFWRVAGLGATTGPKGSKNTIFAALSGGWKLVKQNGPLSLYNVIGDKNEAFNQSKAMPGTVTDLQARYDAWNAQMIAPKWQGSTALSSLSLIGDIAAPFSSVSAPNNTPDGFNWFKTTQFITSGIKSLNVRAATTANTWGGSVITVNGFTDLPKTSSPATMSALTAGYYSFRALNFLGSTAPTMRLSVFRTDNPPVTPTIAGRSGYNVRVSTSAPLSSNERVFVRYSSDTFVTSHMVEVVHGIATIPVQPSGKPVEFTALTSTVDLRSETTAARIDALTLNTTESEKFFAP